MDRGRNITAGNKSLKQSIGMVGRGERQRDRKTEGLSEREHKRASESTRERARAKEREREKD